MWSIALETLIADRAKLFTALVGVVFSIVLMNVQGGFFLGLIGRASLLVDRSQADVWAGHREMHNVDLPRDIPRRWVCRLQSIPGIQAAEPYLMGVTSMTLPSGAYEEVVVVGVDRQSHMGKPWNLVEGFTDPLGRTDGIVVDLTENEKLEYPQVGAIRELGGRRARVAAKSNGIMGFLVFPYVFADYERAAGYLHRPPTVCSYFLVKLQPGADAKQVCDAIRTRIPEIDAFPRQQYSWISINYWMTRTGLGISFGSATLLGLLVGMVMVAQTLYALVLDRLTEFGTLKAIGATERQIYMLLFIQAVVTATAGSLIGLTATGAIQHFYSTPRAPIVVPWQLSLGSCAVVLAICVLSSLIPYLRIRKVDPVIVLQG